MKRNEIIQIEGASFPGKTYTETILEPAFEEAKQHLFGPMMAVNKAHLVMLAEKGIIKADAARDIAKALLAFDTKRILQSSYTGEFEDLFFQVEHALMQQAGDVAGNLHIARSRNDMGVAMYRLALRTELHKLISSLAVLQETLLEVAAEHIETVMLAHTHTQQAQPTTLAHYLLGVFDCLERDQRRLKAAYNNCNRSPLGAAAITTSGFPVSRDRIAELLAFGDVIENSYDAIGGGDYLGEIASAVQLSMIGLGRFVQDLLLWSTQEVGAIRVSDAYVQTSSIMPQKRNPVSFEHVRSLSSAVVGTMNCVHTMLHNTPYGDIVDTEDDMQPYLWRGMKLAGQLYRLLAMVLGTMEVNKDVLLERAKGSLATITELADTLTRECGLPFRTAHTIAARTAKTALANHMKPADISVAVVNQIAADVTGHSLEISQESITQALDPQHFVALRTVPGGPAQQAVRAMLDKRDGTIQAHLAWVEEVKGTLTAAEGQLNDLVMQWSK